MLMNSAAWTLLDRIQRQIKQHSLVVYEEAIIETLNDFLKLNRKKQYRTTEQIEQDRP